MLGILEDTPYRAIAREFKDETGKAFSIRDMEHSFQKLFYNYSKKLWLTPFNIGNFLAYFDGKKIENQNLRSVLLGKMNGLSEREIKLIA